MHVGDASPFVDLPEGDPDRFLDMDGALQAPAIARSTAEPPVPDADARRRTGGRCAPDCRTSPACWPTPRTGSSTASRPGDGEALGPPVYDGAHIRRTSVTDADATWFREVNTDPRSRVAAGLGAEVMRKYQEDVMEACWQQVGDVLAIEAALSRARLSLEVGLRFRDRHLVPLPEGKLFQIASPLADRTLLGEPDGADGRSGRRRSRTGPPTARCGATRQPPVGSLAGVARRAARDGVVVVARAAGEKLVTTLAAGRADVDATRFPVLAVDGLPEHDAPRRRRRTRRPDQVRGRAHDRQGQRRGAGQGLEGA